jgi:hypothetical protein
MSAELALVLSLIVISNPIAQDALSDKSRGPQGGDTRIASGHGDHHSGPGFFHFSHPRHRRFAVPVVVAFDAFAPIPFGPFDPFAFGPWPPVVLWNDPILLPPLAPPRGNVAPAPGPEARGGVRIVPNPPANAPATDVPERIVEDLLITRHRPTLAQRAQAARLEAGGDTMFRSGYYSKAAERYAQTIAQTPDRDEAKFKRGAALTAAGQYGDASRVLRDALRERPDWPFVNHDLLSLFPDAAAIERVFENLDREARRPDAEVDIPFLRAYLLYFSGSRDAAAALFRNPPGGAAPPHYQVFQRALDQGR